VYSKFKNLCLVRRKLHDTAALDETDDVDLADGDARQTVVDVDDEQEAVVVDVDDEQEEVVWSTAHVADARWTVRLDAAHGAEKDDGAGPGEGAADADDAVGRDHGGAREVEDLELGLGDEQDILDKDAVLGRELHERGLRDLVVEVLVDERPEGAGLSHALGRLNTVRAAAGVSGMTDLLKSERAQRACVRPTGSPALESV
jgi:hypothetical protein